MSAYDFPHNMLVAWIGAGGGGTDEWMRYEYCRRWAGVAAIALLALSLAGCGGDAGNGVRVVGEDGRSVDVETPNSGQTSVPDDGVVTPTPTPNEAATPNPTPSSTQPDPSPTPAAVRSGASPDDLAGVPHSTADVRAAVEGAGLVFLIDDERAPLCANTSVGDVVFWAAPAGGTDYGPNWALWVYPDREALEGDWDVSDGAIEPLTGGCELPTGFNYFNANAVLAFVSWQGPDSESLYDELRSPGEDAAKEAFLEMSAAGAD